MNLDGSELRRLSYGHGNKGLPAYSADRSTWVYTDNGELYLRHADSPLPLCLQRRQPMGNFSIDCANPFLSPDGKLVIYQEVYANVSPPGIRICCINSDGTARCVQQEHADDLCPSPDGNTFAFSVNDFRNNYVRLMDLNGKMLETKLIGSAPAFSPDGTRLLYVNNGHFEVYQLRGPQAGTTFSQGQVGRQVLQRDGRFSPGGKSIIFAQMNVGVCLADAELQHVQTLVPQQGVIISHPQMTLDEKQIIVNFHGSNYNYGLYAVNSDGSGLHQLTRGYLVRQYCLWPDGKHVLFTAARVHGLRLLAP